MLTTLLWLSFCAFDPVAAPDLAELDEAAFDALFLDGPAGHEDHWAVDDLSRDLPALFAPLRRRSLALWLSFESRFEAFGGSRRETRFWLGLEVRLPDLLDSASPGRALPRAERRRLRRCAGLARERGVAVLDRWARAARAQALGCREAVG